MRGKLDGKARLTDLRDHLPELALGDVSHSGVDDVHDLSHGTREKHTRKGRVAAGRVEKRAQDQTHAPSLLTHTKTWHRHEGRCETCMVARCLTIMAKASSESARDKEKQTRRDIDSVPIYARRK